ncbi:hypothetical protein BU24DRAFT_424776 [Aaosphaeria arxii CBS 175.79]|uniref:Uncharacterized protein n=1 Tax=Aaosphaeria arxii CBS 175.79 TaxID=1450172 RepID=A0A6A5XLJ9_9PLEO|nr:uncharacterized protein BU24DRAFT_424776 [Aaosphaeria arxii CBS 175.79]KAF2013766.1 hypothetical protein BU24DRAFT_424776 [Aaosphaeria arxii CBS 175.79]
MIDRGFLMLKGMIWQLFGAVGTDEAVQRLIFELPTQRLVRGEMVSRDIRWPSNMVPARKIRFDSKWTRIAMRNAVRRDICKRRAKFHEFAINFTGFSQRKRVYTLETIYRTFQKGEGIMNAWQDGMVTTRAIEAQIIPIVLDCENPSNTHGHVCSGCYMVWNCLDFAHTFRNRLEDRFCPRCITKASSKHEDVETILHDFKTNAKRYSLQTKELTPSDLRVTQYSILTENMSSSNIKALKCFICRLGANIAREKKQFPRLRDLFSSRFDSFIKFIPAFVGDGWQDAYVPVRRLINPNPLTELSKYPLQALPDAIFPVIAINGNTILHGVENVAPTAMYINFMKHTYLPGVLGLVSEIQPMRLMKRDSQQWIEMIRRFDHQFALRRQISHMRKDRIGLVMSETEYHGLVQGWISVSI